MIPQLIIELSEKGESKAAKELAIAYLKHEKNPEILNLLGKLYHNEKQFDKALKCVNQLPETPGIILNKAKCLYYLKRAPEAEKLLRSLPKYIFEEENTQLDLCLYLTAQGKFKESKTILKSLVDKNPRAGFNYGWFLLGENKFQEGYKYLLNGSRTDIRVWGHEWLLKEKYGINEDRRWNGETVDVIAYYLEGGMGDEMIFVRYVEHFQKYCNTVKIFCTKSIKKLLEDCGYQNLYLHEDIIKTKWDKFVPAMSAPYFLGLDEPCENVFFPYLKKTPNPIKEMQEIAGNKKKICIRWKGNPQFEHDQFRSIPIEKLLGLEQFGQLFSIQIEDSDLPKNANVWDLSHLISSWSDTYDIFAESDLVITSCTATAHLAGAMGTKVIVLPPLVPYITWSSDTMNWYPDNVVVLRQVEYNSWDKTINRLYKLIPNILK
jgi:tetratricopeptide (TPR) repeat protein